MKELSLHILDIAQNSINSGARLIEISIEEDKKGNVLIIQVKDDGKGMSDDMIRQVTHPFFSTGKKKTGLGIPLFKQQAEIAGGKLEIHSIEGEFTNIKADFVYNHIDRQPMGDIVATLLGLLRSNPKIEWVYIHRVNSKEFKLDTRQVKKELDGLEITNAEVIHFLSLMIKENLEAISK